MRGIGIFRCTRHLLKYHQEFFLQRQEMFIVQVMRGLKVEKRFEPGMGWGVFAREASRKGEMLMYDLPFMSLELEEVPKNMCAVLTDFGVDRRGNSVLNDLTEELVKESGGTRETITRYLLDKGIDVDLMWVTLLACWCKEWCMAKNPNIPVPLRYMSYCDHYRDDPLEARVMALAHKYVCEHSGLSAHDWDIESFWVTFYKYRSNVFRGRLFPVCPTLVNHSCWPNAEITHDGALVAIRDLKPNDQVSVALYGASCDEVKEKGFAGPAFKCMTPGCEWSKRVEGFEGLPLAPSPQPTIDDRIWVTPMHRAAGVKMGQIGVDADWDGNNKAPYYAKAEKMWATELTKAERVIGPSPKLPGARRIEPGTGVLQRGPDGNAVIPLNYNHSPTMKIGKWDNPDGSPRVILGKEREVSIHRHQTSAQLNARAVAGNHGFKPIQFGKEEIVDRTGSIL